MITAQIIDFKPKPKLSIMDGVPIITKVVDGKVIECINIDELSPAQKAYYFSQSEESK